MIAYLRGILLDSNFTNIIVDVQGVGYDVNIPMSTFDKLPLAGEEVAVFVHTAVREDAITLFGFYSKEELELFKILINISGVGGKLANAILSAVNIDSFVGAIRSSNVAMLNKIPGVGKKTAERLIVELKDKLDNFSSSSVNLGSSKKIAVANSSSSQAIDDTVVALSQLGFKREQSISVIDKIISEGLIDSENITAEELLKLALRNISR